jgi:hypothetical protein
MNDLTLRIVTDMASALALKEYYAFMSWLNIIIVSIDTIIILWRPSQKVCIGTSHLVGVIRAFLYFQGREAYNTVAIWVPFICLLVPPSES